MIDQSFLDLFANIDSKEGFYLWLFMLISFLLGFLVALLLRWSRIRHLKKNLKENEAAFKDNMAELEENLQERNAELQEVSREKVDLIDRLAAMDQAQELHLTEVYQLNQQLEELQNTNRVYTASVDDLNEQLLALKNQNKELTEAPANVTVSPVATMGKEAYDAMQERLNSFEKALTKLSTENKQLRGDLQIIKKKELKTSETHLRVEQEPKLQILTEKTVLFDKIVADDRHQDDLSKIEGIGQFIAKKLNSIGIFSYEDMARWDTKKIEEVTSLIEYLPGRIQKDDWVGQAANLLATHKKSENSENQKNKPAKKAAANTGDDLKIIEGIGPKIAVVLNDAGIHDWATLAATEPGRLKEILEAAGGRFRMHTPYTWPLQARLAAAGRWDELNQYQDELKGGREES